MRERKPPQNIRGQRINAGLIEDDIGLERECSRQNVIELAKIFGVFNAIRQWNIQPAAFLAKRKIALAVDGKGEDIRIILKDFSGAVTLMNIKVNDGRPMDEFALSKKVDGNGNVIEHAEAGAFRTKSMMRSSTQRGAPAVLQRVKRSADGSTNRGESPLYQGLGPGKSDAPDGSGFKSAGDKRLNISRIVCQCNGFKLGLRRLCHIKKGVIFEQLAKHAVLQNRELMSFRQRNLILIGGEYPWPIGVFFHNQ